MFKIPLGWLQLKRRKLRFAVALVGVGFAVVLILMQIGFRESMFESAVRYMRTLDYDLALISPDTPVLAAPQSFTRRRLYQVLGQESVESVAAVYAAQALWRNPYTKTARLIFLVGFDPTRNVLPLPEIASNLDQIKLQDVVLFDGASRPEFGPVAGHFAAGEEVTTEVNDRLVRVGGVFELGTSFSIDGNVVTSDLNFLRVFPDRAPGLIDIGLIRLRDGVRADEAAEAIRTLLPADVLVLTREAWIEREKLYWNNTTPVGYIFALGLAVNLVVGSIIVYQILFADVSDHLPEYATLKAMGYSDFYLARVVLQQAVILGGAGYLIGFAISLWLYENAAEATHLPLIMTSDRALSSLGLTIAMCSVSGLLALRKIRAADPADIFR